MKAKAKEILDKLANRRLKIEKAIVKQESLLAVMRDEWNTQDAKIKELKTERYHLGSDIRLVCSGQEPCKSKGFKPKKKKKKK